MNIRHWLILLVVSGILSAPLVGFAAPVAGDLIKAPSSSSVYYYGADGKRYIFPNEKTYFTWYTDFSTIRLVTDAELAAITIGGNVTYRPGVRMLKLSSDPKTYAVDRGGTLRWVQSEDLAASLYGTEWASQVDDLSEAFFVNYHLGSAILTEADFNLVTVTTAVPTIAEDRGITMSPSVPPTPPVPVGPANQNHALDVLVYIDTQDFYGTFDGYEDLTIADIERVFNLAKKLLYEKAGIIIVIHDIRSMSFQGLSPGGTGPDSLAVWAKNLIQSELNPPEEILIFSKMGMSWQTGGQAGVSLSAGTSSSYCNEFLMNNAWAGTNTAQRGAGVVIVDWHHWYSACGYSEESFGKTRVSELPTSGECSNNPNDVCVLRTDSQYYQCQSTIQRLYSDLDYFTASTIVHELVHTLDPEAYGHYGSQQCTEAMQQTAGYDPSAQNLQNVQQNFGMCPKTFEFLPLRFKGCS